MMRSSLACLLACVALSSGCGDQAAVMQQCLASTMSLMMKFGMRYRDEVCVFQTIGWMDEAGAMVEDIVTADVMTFPAEVQAALAIPNLQACVGKFMDSIASKPEVQECSTSYTEEEAQTIQGLAIGAGHIECLVAIFDG